MTKSLPDVLERLREFDTALLANTIGYIDTTPAEQYYMSGAIRSVTPELPPTVGIAFTCEVDTSTPESANAVGEDTLEGYYRQLDEIRDARLPAVWVVKCTGSRPDHECVAGEGMAYLLHSVGCRGIVTDGGVRDIQGMLKVPFAAYCRQITIHHCRLRFGTFNRPVEIGGIIVRPGEVIHANAEGVIKIPATCLATLPEAAARMRVFEEEALAVCRRTDLAGMEKRRQVVELLAKHGFDKPSSLQNVVRSTVTVKE